MPSMPSIDRMPKPNHQFVLFGRRYCNNFDQPPSWPKMNVTETKVWYFHDRIAACDWADRMAALRFGCQVIDVDQGYRVYENNWYDIQANYQNRIQTARCSDADYAALEQRCVSSEQYFNKVWWPRRSGVQPHQIAYGNANLRVNPGVKS